MTKYKPVGTTVHMTCCGRAIHKRHWTHTEADLSYCTTDCRYCGELLIFKPEQERQNVVPQHVNAVPFHREMARRNPGLWPEDGAGTYYAEF